MERCVKNKIYENNAEQIYRAANVLHNGGVIGYTPAYDQRIPTIPILPVNVAISPATDPSSSGVTPNNRIPAFTAGPD